MKLDAFGSPRSLREAQRTARGVQDAGFAGLWFAEGGRPALNLCGAAALAVDARAVGGPAALTLGTGVSVAFARSPMLKDPVGHRCDEGRRHRAGVQHADVAPARALAAPCGALLEWY